MLQSSPLRWWFCRLAALGWALVLGGDSIRAGEAAVADWARAKVTGGLVVQCGGTVDGLAGPLAQGGRHLVQLLLADERGVTAARQDLERSGLEGLVTVELRPSLAALPYTENLVNLLCWMEGDRLSLAEGVRVLAPGGWLLARSQDLSAAAAKEAGLESLETLADGAWVAARKPWPVEMDQWPQPKHGPDGNAVSNDTLVGPPRRVRWIAGPPQEISNMVSAAGRNFYGGVIARDAFNGLHLWREPLNPSPARGGFTYKQGAKSPRPIAIDDELLVLTENGLRAVSGATGHLRREYPAAGMPLDTLFDAGLILAIDKTAIRAVDRATGQLRWTHEATEPRYVVAGDDGVYFVEGDPRRGEDVALVALEQQRGTPRWQLKGLPWIAKVRQCVVHNGALACEISTLADEKQGNLVQLVSARDGQPLWSQTFIPSQAHMKQARAMFVDNLMWVLSDQGCQAFDLSSGSEQKMIPGGAGHCFPPSATRKFIVHGEMHLTDLDTGVLDVNPITKGNCSRDVGFLPANGLLYTTPKHCICWPMLRDYTALAPAKPNEAAAWRYEELRYAAIRGPAAAPAERAAATGDEWPCYRHDAWRTAATTAELPLKLATRWKTALGGWPQGAIADDWRSDSYVRGPVTPPVVAAGRVFVARPDAQQVVALSAADGSPLWRFTAEGRIDTAPTIHRGLCLFGTRGGWVYALRAADGQPVWRLRVAPTEERIVAYGQVESPWPVAGSVLVVDDVLYFAAGRQPLADGGLLIFAVEPATGQIRWVKNIRDVPQQYDKVARPFYNSSGLEFDNFDLMHREGDAVAMSRWIFAREDGAMSCDRYNGFIRVDLDGSGGVWMPRGCWSYAPRNESEHRKERPFLRPLATLRGNRLYSFSEERRTLFRRDFDLAGGEQFDTAWFAGWKTYDQARKGGDLWRSQRLAHNARWTVTPLPEDKQGAVGSALLLAANALVIGGAEGDVVLLSPEDGTPLGRAKTPPVVWDGLAAVGGQLFATTVDGDVLCLDQPR